MTTGRADRKVWKCFMLKNSPVDLYFQRAMQHLNDNGIVTNEATFVKEALLLYSASVLDEDLPDFDIVRTTKRSVTDV